MTEIGNRTVTMSTFSLLLLENSKVSSLYCTKAGPIGKRDGRTDGRTDRQTDGRTNIKFWGPSTQKALKGKNSISFSYFNKHFSLMEFLILKWNNY